MNLAPPSSQKAADRPISFVLDDQSGTGGGLLSIDLVIRPEELTRTDSSRLAVNQTLGGAWADNFGAGIGSIQLSGHTGWRRTEGDNNDGTARFQLLKEGVFTEWHLRRRAAADAGKDPDLVKLILADALDNFSVVVAPTQFVLRRSRSRPLLSQFQISLLVLDEDIDAESYFQYGKGGKLGYLIRGESSSGSLESLGLKSLDFSLDSLGTMVGEARKYLVGALGTARTAVTGFLYQAKQIYGVVRSAIATGAAVAGQAVAIGQDIARAGIAIFRTFAGIASIPQQVKAWLISAGGVFSNIFCTLRNAISKKVFLQDYTEMFGASNCSSTAGGSPISSLAGKNPFYDVVPTGTTAPITINAAAKNALGWLGNTDPVLAPPSVDAIALNTQSVVDGVTVRALA